MTRVYITYLHRAFWHLIAALLVAAVPCLIIISPASADDLNPGDYFQISYDPVTFDKEDIYGDETFYATVMGHAVCLKDLPISPNKATITSHVIARHTINNTMVTLNTEYTVTIEPFPNEKGDTIEISRSVPLQFPSNATSGEYEVIGHIDLAEVTVKVLLVTTTIPFTGLLPQEETMGVVKYTASEPEPEPAPSTTPPSEPTEEIISEPEPEPNPTPTPIHATEIPEPEQIIPWWMKIIVLIAIATTVFNVVWYLRQRRR